MVDALAIVVLGTILTLYSAAFAIMVAGAVLALMVVGTYVMFAQRGEPGESVDNDAEVG